MFGHLCLEEDIIEQCRNTNILKEESAVSVPYGQKL